MALILRVRTQLGTWRIQNLSKNDKLQHLRERVEAEHHADLQGKPFSKDALGTKLLHDHMTIEESNLHHGDMVYAMVDENKAAVHEQSASSSKRIAKDGSIVVQEYVHVANRNGFRPGMMPLRSMKMAWTLNEFVALDQQFEFKIKRQDEGSCSKAMIDRSIIQDFQAYMMHFDYRKMRVGYLYGSFNKDKSVKVEAIYEPPQDNTDTSFTILDDPLARNVETLTNLLGLQKVGWIFSHPTREKGFHFSGAEILAAAEQQLEAAGGVDDTSFVTIKVTINEKSEMISEAYQVSKLGMQMVAEGAIHVSKHLGMCSVNPTFTAYVEGKPATEVRSYSHSYSSFMDMSTD